MSYSQTRRYSRPQSSSRRQSLASDDEGSTSPNAGFAPPRPAFLSGRDGSWYSGTSSEPQSEDESPPPPPPQPQRTSRHGRVRSSTAPHAGAYASVATADITDGPFADAQSPSATLRSWLLSGSKPPSDASSRKL